MATKRYGRQFVNAAFDRAETKAAKEAETVKKGGVKRKKTILCGPFDGDPKAFNWHDPTCGYLRPTSNGVPVPRDQDPAIAHWTETVTRGKQSLHAKVRQLCKDVYPVGYHHNVISLGTDPGYPDLTLFGPGGNRVIWREEKSMTGVWQEGQREHLLSLHEKGFDVAVWKPCCYLSGLIDVQLAELADVPAKGRGAQRLEGVLNRRPTWGDVAAGDF
jgi:hypothetical protein